MESKGAGGTTSFPPTTSQDIGPREEARLRARRWAAEIDGAIEGLIEAIDRYDLEENARGAIQQTGLLVRSTTTEARTQAQSPEGQRLARDAGHGSEVVQQKAEGVAHEVQERSSQAAHAVQDKAGQATQYVERRWEELKEGVEHGAERAQHAAEVTVDETRQRGRLVAEAGRRAKVAPGHMWQDTKKAVGARARGMAAGLGMYAAAGVVGLAAFVVLTIALVNWFNVLVGAPGGTFLVALLYAIGAGGAVFGARAAQRKGRKEAQERMDAVRHEVRGVTGPVKEAFSTHRVSQDRTATPGQVGGGRSGPAIANPAREEVATATVEGPTTAPEKTSEWNRR